MVLQDCKDQCQQKSCYYYHCDNYKTCWDSCQNDKECQGHCSYKGCDYGLYDTLQELIDAVSGADNIAFNVKECRPVQAIQMQGLPG